MQCRHNIVTQKRKTALYRDCTDFSFRIQDKVLQKKRAQNKRLNETTQNSHIRRMPWLVVVLTMVWSRPDTKVLRIDVTIQWKVGFFLPYDLQQPLWATFDLRQCPFSKVLASTCICNVLTDKVPGFCTDTDPKFRADYFKSTVPQPPFFSQLHEHCYSSLMSRLPNIQWHIVPHEHGPLLIQVWHLVDDSWNSPFPQYVLLNSVSH